MRLRTFGSGVVGIYVLLSTATRMLHDPLQAGSNPSTPKLGHSGAPMTLPRPPAFASLPFNDDPPPQPAAAHELPPKPTAALTPAQQAAGQRSDVDAMETPVAAAAEEHAAVPATLPLVTDAQSSLQLLPLRGAATAAVSALAVAQPGAHAVSTVTAAEPGLDAVSTVAAAQSPEGLAHGQEPPPPPSGPREPGQGDDSGQRGGGGDDKNPFPELLRNAIVFVLLSSAMVVLAYALYESICQLFRDKRRMTPLTDDMVEKQVSFPHSSVFASREAKGCHCHWRTSSQPCCRYGPVTRPSTASCFASGRGKDR